MKALDIAFVLLYFGLVGVIAWRFRRHSSRPVEHFLAGRRMKALPIGLSVMVTTFSAVNYLAFPSEVCGHGLYVLASLPAFFLAAWPVTKVWMPFFHRLKAVSVYEFLETRFDLRVRLFASALFILWRLFWMSVAFFASCKIMHVLTGIPLLTLMIFCAVITTLYTSVGGMKAVIWTDSLQFCVLFGSILIGSWFVFHQGNLQGILMDGGRFRPFVPFDPMFFSFDPRIRITFWSALIGSFVTFLTRFGADQMVMQRYLTARSLPDAQRGLWINGIASNLALLLLACLGLALFAFKVQRGLPEGVPPLSILGQFLKTLPVGMTGLTMAGLFAATMSSIDSGLNSCSAAYSIDFQARLKLRPLSPFLMTILFSVIVFVVAGFVMPVLNRDHTLFEILNRTVNAMGTPLLTIMLFAMFLKKVSSSAVFWGSVAGTGLTACFCFGVSGVALHFYAVASLALTLASVGLAETVRRCGKR